MNARTWSLALAVLVAGATALAMLERSVAPARDAQRSSVRDAIHTAAVFGRAPHARGLHYERSTAQGYAGDIELLVAIDAHGCPRGVAALRHQESAGYGAPLLTRQALADPRHGWLRHVLAECDRTGSRTRLDGTTGATITANAVARAVAAATTGPAADANVSRTATNAAGAEDNAGMVDAP